MCDDQSEIESISFRIRVLFFFSPPADGVTHTCINTCRGLIRDMLE